MFSPAPLLGVGDALDRRERRRLVLGHGAAEQVADADLQRRDDRRQRERDRDRLAVIGVAAAAQHSDRIDGRDAEGRRKIGTETI